MAYTIVSIFGELLLDILTTVYYNISTGKPLHPILSWIGGINMKHSAHFIYEADNIPDHRSRRFGHCPCLLAVIKIAFPTRKKPYLSGNSDTANAK